jgi:exodeoxyribonuclease VIII
MLKCKFDWLRFDDNAVDVKTCLSARPEKFRQKIFDLHYDLQAGFYNYVASLAGITIGTFTFVAVEFANLNACQPYQLGESLCKKAEINLATTLTDFKWCLDNQLWYGYQREDCTIILD